MRMFRVFALLAAVVSLSAAAKADNPAFGDFAKRIAVAPSAAITPAEGVVYHDIPVLLRLSESISGFRYSDFQRADHADLAVYDEQMRRLPYEVQVWDVSGESLLWVKAIDFSAETRLSVVYGCADAADNTPGDTWSAYAGVWHLDELGVGGTVADSTANGFTGTCWDGSTGLAGGVLGGYRQNREPRVASGTGGTVFSGTANLDLGSRFTLETWVQRDMLDSNWDHLFYKKNESGGWNGFASELYGQSGAYGQLSILGQGSNGTGCYIRHGIAAADTWYHIALVYDGYSARLYNNGVLMGSGNLSNAATWNNGIQVALGVDANQDGISWCGSFDEFRIVREPFSDDRAVLEYALQSNAAAFTYAASDNAGTCPVLDAPVVTYADGVFAITASLTEGVATSVKALFDGGIELELAPSGATAPWSATVPVPSTLSVDATYTFRLRAVNNDGFETSAPYEGSFYTGTVSVEATANAAEENLVPGEFIFRRASGSASTAHDLVVAYTLGGTAVNGRTYERLSGSVTIPAGASSVAVVVQPRADAITDADSTVVATVAPGLYAPSTTPATVSISNCRNGELSRYAKRLPLRVNPARYNLDDTLSGLPVLVRLSESDGSGFRYADFGCADYADLAFSTPEGDILPYEVDTWNPAGTSLVWVKVPAFSASTEIYVLYGAATAAVNTPTDVWSAYTGVWHFNEPGDGALTVYDATAHNLDGTTTANSLAIADGVVGDARAPAHAAGNGNIGHIIVPYQSCLIDGYPNITVSFWARLQGSDSWAYLISRKAKDDWDTWGLQFNNSDNANEMRFWRDGSSCNYLSMGGALSKYVWHRITAVYNGNKRDFYVDGVCLAKDSEAWNPMQKNTERNLFIGGPGNDDCWGTFNGDMDEVRIYPGVISGTWETARYAMDAYADFLLPGTVEDVVNSSAPATDYAYGANVDGTASVIVPLTAGSGNVYAVVRDAQGSIVTNLVSDGAIASPATPSFPIASLPRRYEWYDVASYVENGDVHDARSYGARVYNGAVSVVACFDAFRDGLASGSFKISCDCGGEGVVLAEPLDVAYVLSGDTVNGTDYAALSGTVTIPAGASSAFVEIEPLAEGADGSVTLTLVPAFCPAAAGAAEATLNIVAAGRTPGEKRARFAVRGYEGDVLEDFPALVRLHEGDGDFTYDNVRYRDTGTDLHFTLADGTPVAHEIDTWNYGGESTVWVQVPELKAGATVILRYGGVAQTVDATPLWTGYAGIWHVSTPTASDTYLNSTANGVDLWNYRTTVSDGIVGGARTISNGNYNDIDGPCMGCGHNAALDVGGTFTVSSWLRYKPGQAPSWDRVFGHKNTYNSNNGWEVTLAQNEATKLDIRGSSESSVRSVVFPNGINDGEWHYLVVVYDGSTVTAYENGEFRTSGEITSVVDNTHDLRFGNDDDGNEVTFKGTMDEIRFTGSALSAARIRADYLTVTEDLLVAQKGFATILLLL